MFPWFCAGYSTAHGHSGNPAATVGFSGGCPLGSDYLPAVARLFHELFLFCFAF